MRLHDQQLAVSLSLQLELLMMISLRCLCGDSAATPLPHVIRHDIYVIRAYTCLYVRLLRGHLVLGRHMTKPVDGPASQFQVFH